MVNLSMNKEIYFNEKWHSYSNFKDIILKKANDIILRGYVNNCFCDCQCHACDTCFCDCQCVACYTSCDCLPPCITCHKTCDGYIPGKKFDNANEVKPYTTHLEITEKCNQQCTYCYNQNRRDQPSGSFDFKALERTINELSNISDSIIFTGGEPFVESELLFSAIEVATNLKFSSISINTNGTLVNRDNLNKIYTINKSVSFLVSVPSFNDNYLKNIIKGGNKTQVINTLKCIINVFGSGNLSTNTVITKRNINEIYEIAKIINSVGVTSFKYSIVSPSPGSQDISPASNDIDTIFSLLRNARNDFVWESFSNIHSFPLCRIPLDFLCDHSSIVKCNMGDRIIAVDHKLRVKPCPELPAEIYGVSFEEFSKKREQIFLKSSDINHEFMENDAVCKRCELMSYCGASCSARRYNSNLGISDSDPYAVSLSKEDLQDRKQALNKAFKLKQPSITLSKVNRDEFHVLVNDIRLGDIIISENFLSENANNIKDFICEIKQFVN